MEAVNKAKPVWDTEQFYINMSEGKVEAENGNMSMGRWPVLYDDVWRWKGGLK